MLSIISRAMRFNPYTIHYPQGLYLLVSCISPSLKQRRRTDVLFQTHSLYTVSHDTACVHCCFSLVIQVSWWIIRILHARTRARTIVASVTSPVPFSLFLSVRISIAYVCIRECRPWRMSAAELRTGRRARAPEGSPARDWCVMGGDRSATHASAMTTSPHHRISSVPLLAVLFWIPPIRRFLGDIHGIPSRIDLILTSYDFISNIQRYISNDNLVFSDIRMNSGELNTCKFAKLIRKEKFR